MTFGEALKTLRRDMYVHAGEPYTAVIVTPNEQMARTAYEEAVRIFSASSMKFQHSILTRDIHTSTGAKLIVRTVSDELRGIDPSAVIILAGDQYSDEQADMLKAWNRAPLTLGVPSIYGL